MTRMLRSFRHALDGLDHAWRTQANLRIHVAIALGAAVTAILLRVSVVEGALVGLTIAVVFAAELFNTAIEALVDLASPGQHVLAKVAKDCAAGAVFVCAAGAVVVGGLIFGPRLLNLLAR